MAVSSALATSRRSLLASGVAAVIAVVALIVVLVSGSDSDSTNDGNDSSPSTEVAELLADAQETVAAAQAAASRAQEAATQVAAAVSAAEQTAAEAGAAAELARESAASAALEAAAASRLTAGATPDDDTTGAASTEDSTATENESASTSGSAQANNSTSNVNLPGEPDNESGPATGTGLAVIGVDHDSSLNVRAVPVGDVVARLSNSINVDSESAVIVRAPDSPERLATLDLNTGVTATGNTRKLRTTVWHEIRMGERLGWASSAFLSPLGSTSDVTADLIEDLDEAPTAASLTELAQIVAQAAAGEDSSLRIVVSGTPVDGDLSEVTVDVLDLPDDSIRGYRLQVFAEKADSGSYTLRSVESTLVCYSHRGVSDSGACN